MRFVEHKTKATGLADLLLYDAMVEDGIMLLQDGSLLCGWSYRGPDMDSATHLEMAALSARLNSIMRLGSGWMLQANAIRSAAPEYPRGDHFPDPVSLVIDIERYQQFSKVGNHFETEYFLTLSYLPPELREERIRGFLFNEETEEATKGAAARALETFRAQVGRFEDVLSSVLYVDRLNAERKTDEEGFPVVYDQLLEYIHRCITGHNHPIELPPIPACLSDMLATEDFVGGTQPRIGKKQIRVVAIDGFPRQSRPGILRQLDSLPIEYRWSTRAILLDPEQARASLDKTRKKWKSRVRGFKDQVLKTETGPVNLHALEMVADAEDAMGAASAGDVHFCYFTSVMVVMGNSTEEVNSAVAMAVKTISNLGFGCRVEEINAVDAWRGTLPGDGYSDVRRTMLNTLNLADMMPTTAVWAGSLGNLAWAGPATGKVGEPVKGDGPQAGEAQGGEVRRADCERGADYSAKLSGRAVLVMQLGRVVYERYDNQWTADRPHPLASGTKSFTGVMAMLAVQDGLLTLDEPVADTITEWKSDPRKRGITVRHLLTLSSGLEAGPAALESRGGSRMLGEGASARLRRKGLEDAGPPPGDLAAYSVSEQVKAIHDPGTKFEYGPTHFYVFCEVLNRKLAASGRSEKNTMGYLRARVFNAIGIKAARIGRDRAGNPNLPGGCLLTAREWAKFGQFVLDRGSVRQDDASMRQVLKPELLEECFKPSSANSRYGLTWWLGGSGGEISVNEADTGGESRLERRVRDRSLEGVSTVLGPDGKAVQVYMAAGLGKQRLYVIPQFDLVVVRFAEATREGMRFDDREFLGRVLGVLGRDEGK